MPTRFRVEISRTAETDVDDIWSFIAADDPVAATDFLLGLEAKTETLERFPQRCPSIPENAILGTNYHHLLYGEYRVIFRISGKAVYVLRVIHGARLLDSTFLEDV